MTTILDNEERRLFFVGGKGGVGKTTTAAAVALALAAKLPKSQILLISTDPAHSLGDVFEVELDNKPRPLQERSNLSVRELDAAYLLKIFKTEHEKELKLLGDRGTYFDSKDIQSFFDLSFPGIDEVMAVLEMAHLLEDKNLKCLVVDTAPTGHTLSLLRLPKILDTWLDVFELMQEKHHILQTHFAGKRQADFVDSFLERMRVDLKRVRHLFHDSKQTEFIAVMLPEMLSLNETKRLVFSLKRQQIPVHHLVVNGVIFDNGCSICLGVQKKQEEVLSKLKDAFPYLKITQVPLAPKPIQGIQNLKEFAGFLRGEKSNAASLECKNKDKKVVHQNTPISLAGVMRGNPKLWIVGGKGGVGKTTVACASALHFANTEPSKKFLLFSIDPAHSLSDCLDVKVGNHETKVLENLYALELNANKLLDVFKKDYSRTVDELFDQFSGGRSYQSGMDFGYDRQLLHGLMEMSPPGLEELMALYKVIDFLNRDENPQKKSKNTYNTIIFDAAPSGHLFRFLELPQMLREWLKAIFHLLMKYKRAMPLGEAAGKLVTLSKEVRQILQVLENKEETYVILVTKPEPMVVAESKRFIEKLKQLKITLNLTVVNMLRDNQACPFCRSRREEQMPFVKSLKKMSPKECVPIPLLGEDVRGVAQLKEFGKHLYS